MSVRIAPWAPESRGPVSIDAPVMPYLQLLGASVSAANREPSGISLTTTLKDVKQPT